MPKQKKQQSAPVEPGTADTVEMIEKLLEKLGKKQEEGMHCMDCGREFREGMKIYTAKYRSGAIAIVCPVCACKKKIRLKTPYISVDAMRRLKIGKGET